MNFSRFHLLVVFVASLTLTGCGGGKKLSDFELNRLEFTKALASDYGDYSKLQQLRLDLTDTEHFEQKALLAAEGVQIDPDQPALRDITDPAKVEELNKARRVLLDSVNSNSIQSDPRASARAYFLFDCWVEAEEEKWKMENLEACRNEFFDVVNYLSVLPNKNKKKDADKKVTKPVEDAAVSTEQGMYEEDINENEQEDKSDESDVAAAGADVKPEDAKAATTKKPEAERQPAPKKDSAKSEAAATPAQAPLAPQGENSQPVVSIPASKAADKTIYFDSDDVKINEAEMKAIDDLVAAAKEKKDYTIVVNGHTDRAEKDDINLSIRRAKAVGTELIKKGVSGDKIQYYGYGGTDPEKATKADVKEQLNRRVEIFIQ